MIEMVVIEMVVGLVIYLAIGWYIADKVNVGTEYALLDALIVLFWPLVVVLGLFVFIFWS